MTNDDKVSHLLATRVMTQLGARSDLIDKISLCHSDNKVGTIKIKEEEFGKEFDREFPIWKGMLVGDKNMIYKAIVVSFGDQEEPEFLAIISGFTSMNSEQPEAIYGLHFTYEQNDVGKWFTFSEDWMPLSFHHRLLLAAWLEGLTQSGGSWAPCLDSSSLLEELLRKILVFI
jgi:hypothetical protein